VSPVRGSRPALPIAALCLLLMATPLALAQPTFKTWHPWQMDSLLVAWVLAQTRTPAPMFESVQRGSDIPADQALDTPDSPYRRTGQRTAFEEALRLSQWQHPCVPRLRDAVRVVELAAWLRPEFPEVEAFQEQLLKAIPKQAQPGGLEPAMAVIARFCQTPAKGLFN
jgi:hypothetical protein